MKGNKQTMTIVVSVLVGAVVGFVIGGLAFGFGGGGLQGTGVVAGGGAEPTYGAAVVDGSYAADWNLGSDFFANMYRAAKADKKVEGKLYLRYDCGSGTMYALVLSAGDWPVLVEGFSEVWIKINGSPVNFSQFAWVGQGYDGNNNHARGYEAAFPLGQGDYSLVAHVNAYDDGQSQTTGTLSLGLHVSCYTPTAVFLNYFRVEGQMATGGIVMGRIGTAPSTGGLILGWETATELDNMGFNVYRAPGASGPWTKLNAQLIPSQVPPGSTVGSTYKFIDQTPSLTNRFYLLEDINTSGVATRHGPISY